MAVNDHGLEVLKKSGELVTPGNPSNQFIKVGQIGNFVPPKDADAITAAYPNATTEVYSYRQGGASGTVLATVTVVYTNASKADLASVVVT